MPGRHTFTRDENSRGGAATYERHGPEHFRRARLIGVARTKERDPDYWRRLALRGVEKRRANTLTNTPPVE